MAVRSLGLPTTMSFRLAILPRNARLASPVELGCIALP